MKQAISGYLPIRNGFQLGYCWQEAVESLLPVCEEVIICDSESTDGTLDYAKSWAAVNPRIRVVTWPWPYPQGDKEFFVRWLNFAREHCRHPMQLTLDADEVLSPEAYPEIRKAADRMESRWFHRLNFWKDLNHLAPSGTVCGDRVVRLGPTNYWMPSDGWHTPEPIIRQEATSHPTLEIFHYGFVRKADKFLAKSRVMQPALIGSHDERLKRAEATGEDWVSLCPFTKPLQKWSGTHPLVAHTWLREQGHTL